MSVPKRWTMFGSGWKLGFLFACLPLVSMPVTESLSKGYEASGSATALDLEMSHLAKQLVDVAGANKTYRVAAFSGPSGGGPELQLSLIRQLEMQGVQLSQLEYHIEVRGRFERIEIERGTIGVRISVELFDDSGKPFAALGGREIVVPNEEVDRPEIEISNGPELARDLFDSPAIPRLLAINSSIGTNVGEPRRSEILEQQRRKPVILVEESRVFSDRNRLYGLEIKCRRDATSEFLPRLIEVLPTSKAPYIPLDQGEEYILELINYADHEVAVDLRIDGLSPFQFAEAGDNAPKLYLIPPAANGQPGITEVKGWYINEKVSQAFRVTGFPESAAGTLGIEPSDAMGQISVQFAAAWNSIEERNNGEGITRSTGQGGTFEDLKLVVPRYIGGLRATLVIRYERPLP